MRRVLARFFEVARGVIEAHGGTVEKFIGDAVMAIFGVPVLHEDDALRAVRAAHDLHQALGPLNDELSQSHGVTLELRTGVNTGEVVTGTHERLATGDAVNVAARLQQLASPGEVLLGDQVVRLVRGSVEVTEVGPTELKGKSRPVAVYRLVAVVETTTDAARCHDAPLVGRAHELRILSDAFARVVREQSCGLFTLLGAAGVGKSRLVEEFVATVDATVVRGRCLSYGEGITYWPVVQVVKGLVSTEDDVTALLSGDHAVAAGIAALFGEAAAATSSSEIAWAVRKVLERVAAARPLVVVFDDLHWGEPTLFDLIEHVTDLSRSVPIFLLCVARPELMDRRPGWGGGKLNATAVLLEPLDEEETDTLIEELAGSGVHLSKELRDKVRHAAGGNPLFVEEMLSLVTDAKTSDVEVPPSVHALLAARLDQLESKELRVLERGAVEGQSFHLGAIRALSPTEPEVPSCLVGLVRKDLIRPDHPTLPGDDAFRFRHLLIRDAAYDGLAKSVRADLHVRFAHWLAQAVPDLVELDEIVGYHLEQAVKYRAELGPFEEATNEIATTASVRLRAAGLRGLDRGDMPAGINLLERASGLRAHDLDVTLELTLAQAYWYAGRVDDARGRAAATADRAEAGGDEVGALEARLCVVIYLMSIDPHTSSQEMGLLIEQGHDAFDDTDNDVALAYLWWAVGWIEHHHGRFGAGFDAAMKAMQHADAAGLRFFARASRDLAAAELVHGPTPAGEGLRRLAEMQDASPFYEPFLGCLRAVLLTDMGSFVEARSVLEASQTASVERGELILASECGWAWSRIAAAAGNDDEAERAIRRVCEDFERLGDLGRLSTVDCDLAQCLYRLGRYEEAETSARRGLELGADDDIATQAGAAQVLAKIAARRGDGEEALALGRRAVNLAETTDSPLHRGETLFDLAEVHRIFGEDGEARACLSAAIEQFELKGAAAFAEQARHKLVDLEVGT
jgi:tetratricopeptide (TPR) repeat protein